MLVDENLIFFIFFLGFSVFFKNLKLNDIIFILFFVKWSEVLDVDKNGIIISYIVSYQVNGFLLVENIIVYVFICEVNLIGLIKNMNYSVRVLVFIEKGDGNYGDFEVFLIN